MDKGGAKNESVWLIFFDRKWLTFK